MGWREQQSLVSMHQIFIGNMVLDCWHYLLILPRNRGAEIAQCLSGQYDNPILLRTSSGRMAQNKNMKMKKILIK